MAVCFVLVIVQEAARPVVVLGSARHSTAVISITTAWEEIVVVVVAYTRIYEYACLDSSMPVILMKRRVR